MTTHFARWLDDPFKFGSSRFGKVRRSLPPFNNDALAEILLSGDDEVVLEISTPDAFFVYEETKHLVRAPIPDNPRDPTLVRQRLRFRLRS
jgi:hypothetical protein